MVAPNRKLRIGIYCHSIAPSIDGVCRRFTGILEELHSLGYEVVLFTLEQEPEEIPDGLLDVVTIDHVSLSYYPDKKISVPSLRSWMRILGALWKHRPDIVHVTADGLSQFFAIAGMFTGSPVVGSFHTDLLDLLTVLKASWFQKWCVQTKEWVDNFALDSCATTSESFKKKLAEGTGLYCEHTIITAVDNSTFSPDKKDATLRKEMTFGHPKGFLCVYVGRISKEKRIDIIIEAVRQMDNTYLAIVGDGPAAAEYAALHGEDNRIYCKPSFLNHMQLAKVYASADVHVSASTFETLGNTVLEAFACGIPVVVPKTQGFINTVEDGETGFFFSPGDSTDARTQLERLRKDSKLRTKMGKAGRKGMGARTINRVVEDLLSWYERALEKRKNRPLWWSIFIFCYLGMTVPFTTLVYNMTYIATAVLLFVGIDGPFCFPDMTTNYKDYTDDAGAKKRK